METPSSNKPDAPEEIEDTPYDRFSPTQVARLGPPVAVFLVTIAVLFPVTRLGFVNWDDRGNFVENPHFRGLSWGTFHWAVTTRHMGHYQPLNWLTFAADYEFSGLDPRQFHRTQLLLHGVAAVLVYFVIRRLLGIMMGPAAAARTAVPALLASLFFAIHPLRIESVAWLSARTDILAAIFLLSGLLVYLRGAIRYAQDPTHTNDDRLPTRTLVAVGLLYILALSSKIMAITFPAILLLLDVHPLRRVSLGGLFSRRGRIIWREKLPLLAIAIVAAATAFPAAGAAVATLVEHPIQNRIAAALCGLAFYLQKTLLPIGLSPLYEFPATFGLTHPLVLASAASVFVLGFVCILLRHRLPGLLMAAACYVIVLLPVVGLTQRGSQLVADRYSYLGCIPWAVAAAYVLSATSARLRAPTVALALALLVVFGIGANHQITVWTDSFTLWRHAIALDRTNAFAHVLLADAHVRMADDRECSAEDAAKHRREAEHLCDQALAIRKSQEGVRPMLAHLLADRGATEEAIEQCRQELSYRSENTSTRLSLARLYDRQDSPQAAAEQYQEILRRDLDHPRANLDLARLLVINEAFAQAEPLIRRVLKKKPEDILALHLLADVCAATDRVPEALMLLDRAIGMAKSHRADASLKVLEEARARHSARPASQPSPNGPPAQP